MQFSIVTISFNQANYIRQAIESVLAQKCPSLEYIIVDPGSTDGSREIILEYKNELAKVVLEPDGGPGDGLNKGFSFASGDIFGFLNSDDTFLPGAFQAVTDFFSKRPDIDVVSGHSRVIDGNGRIRRNSYSDTFRADRVAYGTASLMQPSTFFRSSIYRKTNGFNVMNRVSWDIDLFLDFHRKGARFSAIDEFFSCYRVVPGTITAQQRTTIRPLKHQLDMFQRFYGREFTYWDQVRRVMYMVCKYTSEPRTLRERILRGSMNRIKD